VLVVEALPSTPGESVGKAVEAVLAELAVAVDRHCGGRCETSVLGPSGGVGELTVS
jgi:hypothetical protein